MKQKWRETACSADNYRNTDWRNEIVASCVMEQQKGTREGACSFLRSDILLLSLPTQPLAKRGVLKYLTSPMTTSTLPLVRQRCCSSLMLFKRSATIASLGRPRRMQRLASP